MAKLLKLDDEYGSTDDLARIFHLADTEKNGFLTSRDFLVAYDLMIAHKDKHDHASIVTYVEAIRYGRVNDEYVTSIYAGSVKKISVFQSILPRGKPQNYNGTLANLIDMVNEDSRRNATESKHNVMWWIDVPYSERSVSLIRELNATFGLPEESEAMLLSNNLNAHDRSRFMTGIGMRNGKAVHSLAVGIESMWLKNRPVVDRYPPWIRKMNRGFLTRSLFEYFYPRIDYMQSFASRPDTERQRILLTAESVAKETCPKYYEPMATGHEGSDAMSRGGDDYLLTKGDIRKRGDPKYEFDVVIFHLLKYEGSTSCMFSFRCFDDYGEGDVSPEGVPRTRSGSFFFRQQAPTTTELPRHRAHRGILGRLLTAIRAKIIDVIDHRGVSFDGQLADSSVQLLANLIHTIHDFSASSSLAPLETWETELDFAAMTKHDKHLKVIKRLLNDAENYINPFTHILESQILSESKRKGKKHVLKEILLTDQSKLENENIRDNRYLKENFRHCHRDISINSDEILAEINSAAHDSYADLLHAFCRKSNFVEERMCALVTNASLFYESQIEIISDTHTNKLDEQRTFYSFVLTIFQVLSWPITFMTGYWGMNFDNMPELHQGTYRVPFAPGFNLYWFVGAVIYFLLFVSIIHYKILHAAT